MRKFLLLTLFFISQQSFAETLYLRSSTACPNNGDGTAYACAASDGAAGAYNSSANSNVQWGVGAGKVSAGDTLYVCGLVPNFSLIPSITGTAGNVITISGACPNDPGSIYGGASNNFTIDIEFNKSYFTVEYLKIGWAIRTALFVGIADAAGANATDITVRYNTINNVGATTVTNVCHALYFNAISGTGALYRINNVQIVGNIFTGTDTSCFSDNNDNVNLENLGTGAIIRDNESYGGHEGFDISTGTGVIFERNYAHDNLYAGVKFHGIMGCMVGTRAVGNIIADNAVNGFAFQDQELGLVSNNNIKHDGTLHGLDIESVNTWTGTCVPSGNTYKNNYISADYANGAARIYNTDKATFESGNTWDGNVLRQVGSNTTLIYWTSDTGSNITISNFAANWQATHTKDLAQTNPLFEAGVNPSTSAGFKLKASSPLLRTGSYTNLGNIQDFGNRAFHNPPSIGAWEFASGDTASSRTTRN